MTTDRSKSFLNKKLLKKQFVSFSIALSIAALFSLLLITSPPFIKEFRLKMLDMRFKVRGPHQQADDIVFVEMDQHSIEEMGRWPWPREKFARIVQELKQQGARYVLFDVLFTNEQQVFVDKERVRGVMGLQEGVKGITGFIDQVDEALKNGDVTAADTSVYLQQLKSGMGDLQGFVRNNLDNAVTDNDLLFEEAVKGAGNVFLGNMLKMLDRDDDILRNNIYPKLLEVLREQLKDDVYKTSEQLNIPKEAGDSFDKNELDEFILKARIMNMLESNTSMGLDIVSERLKGYPLPMLSRLYYDSLYHIVDEKIEQAFAEGVTDFRGIMWKYEIMDAHIIDLFRKHYSVLYDKNVFYERFGFDVEGDVYSLYPSIDFTPPLDQFASVMEDTGFLNANPDIDGVVRRVPLLVRYKDKAFAQLGFSLVLKMLSAGPGDIEFVPGKYLRIKNASADNAYLGDITIPVDAHGQMLINWTGSWQDTFRHVSCADIYNLWQLRDNIARNKMLSPEELMAAGGMQRLREDEERLKTKEGKINGDIKGKICIIGLTAPGTHDYNPIPFEAAYPVVGTHANVLNTILKEDYIREFDKTLAIGLIFAFAIFMGFVVPRVSAFAGLVFILALGASFTYMAFDMFISHNIWVYLIEPLGAIFFSYLGITIYNFIFEEGEKKWIRKAFGHYVSKNVMEEILSAPDALRLGGERKILSVLFSDIRSFTTYSEKRKPEEVVSILNEYLDEMTRIIFRNNGTLDKYVGDEIMAIFGAPGNMSEEEHAYYAVKTAVEMIVRLRQMQDEWQQRGLEPLDIGIGVNTGEMVVGNMGSEERMDYTVIGDAVNLGARVEALTRNYENSYIIITEFTYEYIKERVEVKELDSVKVKGKNKPVVIYEVLSLKD